MKPTIIGSGAGQASVATAGPRMEVAGAMANPPVVLSSTFPAALSPEQQKIVADKLAGMSFPAIPLREIATLGNEAEIELHRTLDGFLARISQFDNPRLFSLVTKLNDAVAKENLPELADRILYGKPGLMDRIRGFLSKKGMEKALAEAWEETKRIVQGKTRTLVDLVNEMDKELRGEQSKLEGEIRSLEQLKDAYRKRFSDFVVAVAYMGAFLERARLYVNEAQLSANPADMVEKAKLDELSDKLQALESRTLALEGTLTRLPADQLVIRQLQNAGISTLQETTTTAASRFASIKMTLLTIHGALVTKGVQQLANQGAALDANLTEVRSKLMKDVVTSAANAPGDNRVAQAEQLRGIIKETTELVSIVDQARVSNQQKFGQARQMFDDARKEMLALGQHIRPDSNY